MFTNDVLGQFKVISVSDPVTFYARIVRHCDTKGILHSFNSDRFMLDLDLQAFFSHQQIKIPVDPQIVEKDQLCVWEREQLFYRLQSSAYILLCVSV